MARASPIPLRDADPERTPALAPPTRSPPLPSPSLRPTQPRPETALHPVCAAFPPSGTDAIRDLAGRIAARGSGDPVVVHRGLVVDGRDALVACALARIPPERVPWEGEESGLVSWIVEQNLGRRRWNTSQRALVAARLAPLERGQRPGRKNTGVLTQAQAAGLLRVSERSVRSAREVLEHGDEALIERVQQGGLAVSAAVEQIRSGPAPREEAYPERSTRRGAFRGTAYGARACGPVLGDQARPEDDLWVVRDELAQGEPPPGDQVASARRETPERYVLACVRWLCEALALPEGPTIANPAVGAGVWLRAFAAVRPGAILDRFDTDAQAAGLAGGRRLGGAGGGSGEMRVRTDWLCWQPGRAAKRKRWDACVCSRPSGVDLARWVEVSLERAEVVAVHDRRHVVDAEVPRLGHRPTWIVGLLDGERATDEVLLVWQRGVASRTRLDWIEVGEGSPEGSL